MSSLASTSCHFSPTCVLRHNDGLRGKFLVHSSVKSVQRNYKGKECVEFGHAASARRAASRRPEV